MPGCLSGSGDACKAFDESLPHNLRPLSYLESTFLAVHIESGRDVSSWMHTAEMCTHSWLSSRRSLRIPNHSRPCGTPMSPVFRPRRMHLSALAPTNVLLMSEKPSFFGRKDY